MFDSVMRFLNSKKDYNPACAETNLEFDETEIVTSIAAILRKIVIADGHVKKEEIVAATDALKSLSSLALNGEFEVELLSRTNDQNPLFPVAFIVQRSLSLDQFSELRKSLVDIALSDGEFHPYEHEFIALFDALTPRETKRAGKS